jgi:hypothetical protein
VKLQNLPIRSKLLAMVLLPLLVALPLLGVLLLVWGNAALDQLLITKVRSDLAVAHGYFDARRQPAGDRPCTGVRKRPPLAGVSRRREGPRQRGDRGADDRRAGPAGT